MNKVTYAVLTLLFNCYGVPFFLQGNTKKGVFTIISAVVTCSVVAVINAVKGIILAIKIFQMSDEEFEATDKATLTDAVVGLYND